MSISGWYYSGMTHQGWRVYGVLVGLCILIGFGFWLFASPIDEEPQPVSPEIVRPEVVVEGSAKEEFVYEVLTTDAQHAKGLSGRLSVPENYGMLFVFDAPQKVGFWMKDMYVPIDMLWLADDGTILGIEEAVSPDTYPTPFFPPEPVRFVLETRAWEAYRQGWEVGERISLPTPYGSGE